MKTSKSYFEPILPIVSTGLVILLELLRHNYGIHLLKPGLLILLLTFAIVFYLRLSMSSLLENGLTKAMIMASYLGSILFMYMVKQPNIQCFWMLGGLLVSMLIDYKLGLLMQFNLIFLMGIAFTQQLETVLQFFVMGALMSFLSSYLKQKSTVIYASIILLSTNITLAFIIHNFVFDIKKGYNYLGSLFSILAVLATAFFLCFLYDRFALNLISKRSKEKVSIGETILEDKKEDLELDPMEEKDQTDTKDPSSTIDHPNRMEEISNINKNNNSGLGTSYELLNQEDNELLRQLEAVSPALYQHALTIGDLAGRAAKLIQADVMLAKAGGLYHEIGKIKKGNYIEEGLKIAEEYHFPAQLKAILKQHNIKYEKPTSIEAAIVMLADNVVSTIEYIEKTQNHKYTNNKIIDNIFQMRLDKGNLDKSNISVKDYKLLKEFFQKEFS